MSNIFDASYIWEFIPKLIKALPITIEMTIVAAIAGLFLGFLIALAKIKNIKVLSQICVLYVSFM